MSEIHVGRIIRYGATPIERQGIVRLRHAARAIPFARVVGRILGGLLCGRCLELLGQQPGIVERGLGCAQHLADCLAAVVMRSVAKDVGWRIRRQLNAGLAVAALWRAQFFVNTSSAHARWSIRRGSRVLRR